jgi:hypothetical protein
MKGDALLRAINPWIQYEYETCCILYPVQGDIYIDLLKMDRQTDRQIDRQTDR